MFISGGDWLTIHKDYVHISTTIHHHKPPWFPWIYYDYYGYREWGSMDLFLIWKWLHMPVFCISIRRIIRCIPIFSEQNANVVKEQNMLRNAIWPQVCPSGKVNMASHKWCFLPRNKGMRTSLSLMEKDVPLLSIDIQLDLIDLIYIPLISYKSL